MGERRKRTCDIVGELKAKLAELPDDAKLYIWWDIGEMWITGVAVERTEDGYRLTCPVGLLP